MKSAKTFLTVLHTVYQKHSLGRGHICLPVALIQEPSGLPFLLKYPDVQQKRFFKMLPKRIVFLIKKILLVFYEEFCCNTRSNRPNHTQTGTKNTVSIICKECSVKTYPHQRSPLCCSYPKCRRWLNKNALLIIKMCK